MVNNVDNEIVKRIGVEILDSLYIKYGHRPLELVVALQQVSLFVRKVKGVSLSDDFIKRLENQMDERLDVVEKNIGYYQEPDDMMFV